MNTLIGVGPAVNRLKKEDKLVKIRNETNTTHNARELMFLKCLCLELYREEDARNRNLRGMNKCYISEICIIIFNYRKLHGITLKSLVVNNPLLLLLFLLLTILLQKSH